MIAPPQFAKASALGGIVFWIALLPFETSSSAETNLINRILLLAILIVFPLAFSLVATPTRKGQHSLAYRLTIYFQPLAAIAVVIAFYRETGLIAALLAAPWFGVCLGSSLFGSWRLLPRGFYPAEEVAIDAGLIFLPVGGVWLITSRLGIQPFGFGDTMVLLTAVHFHFAGFAAPILAGMVGRTIPAQGFWRRLFVAAVACLMAGIWLVAGGITLSPRLALAGAIVISLGLDVLAIRSMVSALSSRRALPQRILLILSSLSVIAAMCLAIAYAYSVATKILILDIPQMALTHGLLNSLGFAVCGLLAWELATPAAECAVPSLPFSRLSGGRFTGPGYFQESGIVSKIKPAARGLVDDFSVFHRADFAAREFHSAVRAFYEQTYRFSLTVRPTWHGGFRLASRVVQWMGTRLGQMRLPADTGEDGEIETRMYSLDDALDGRTGVRAWVRTRAGTNTAMYVAAYATHSTAEITYMNIAFPILGGNVTSVLYLMTAGDTPGTLSLSTLPSACRGGDQGVYFANRFLPIRLPINEVIIVWPASAIPDSYRGPCLSVQARHEMWFCGIKFLRLDYDIFG